MSSLRRRSPPGLVTASLRAVVNGINRALLLSEQQAAALRAFGPEARWTAQHSLTNRWRSTMLTWMSLSCHRPVGRTIEISTIPR